jgi:hypothetical protein
MLTHDFLVSLDYDQFHNLMDKYEHLIFLLKKLGDTKSPLYKEMMSDYNMIVEVLYSTKD